MSRKLIREKLAMEDDIEVLRADLVLAEQRTEEAEQMLYVDSSVTSGIVSWCLFT